LSRPPKAIGQTIDFKPDQGWILSAIAASHAGGSSGKLDKSDNDPHGNADRDQKRKGSVEKLIRFSLLIVLDTKLQLLLIAHF
jgi:hypothetical protein